MDVQAAAQSGTILPPAHSQIVSAPPPSGSASTPAVAPATPSAVTPASSGSNSSAAGSSTSNTPGSIPDPIGPTPGLATLPAGASPGSKKHESDPGLSSGIATLYNVQEQNIAVSFQVNQDPNEVVTVFTDKQTGKVIVQFPSETMIALAKLFDKLDGSVVNKKV